MYAAHRPSGEVTDAGGDAGAAASCCDGSGTHVYAAMSHCQRRPAAMTVTCRPSRDRSNVVNGSRAASTASPTTVPSAAASRAASNTGVRVRRAGSTMMKSAPAGVVVRYQNRPSGSHVTGPGTPLTSGIVCCARNRSARA
jgi:hypothetical protein